MVGIVVVSHSEKLAHEVIELCNEMKKYDFPVINGSGTEGGNLGSDPMRIKDAIEKAYTNEGVLIFCDIGSSILNSEMAMEFWIESYENYFFMLLLTFFLGNCFAIYMTVKHIVPTNLK